MNSINKSFSIVNLPEELQKYIAKDMSAKDVCICMWVSKLWKALFQSDIVWEHMAEEFKLNKLPIKYKSYFKLPYISPLGSKFYTLVQEKLNIIKKYPKEFFKLLGGTKNLLRIPTVEISYNKLPLNSWNTCLLEPKYFIYPLTIANFTNASFIDEFFIMLRIKNNATGELYHEAIGFYNKFLESEASFRNRFQTKNTYRVISEVHHLSEGINFDRLRRLIQGKPVGTLWYYEEYPYESRETTPEGKSVLELI